MIIINELSMQFGDRVLYSNVNLKLKGGNRYGLIGGNGSGKTTLIKILQGEETQTDGEIEFEPNRTRGYLRQDHNAFDGFTIMETVLQGHPRFWEVMKKREELYAKAELSEEEGNLVAELEMEFADLDGYMAEARAGELLEGLGIPTEQHNDPLTNLVGGWKLRVLLAQVLFARPDILMLDEPTNHLDILTISWLEKLLKQYEGLVVVISHDRHFLDNVCTHILDVDYKEINQFTGNYSQWETAIRQARERAQAHNDRMQKKKEELQDFVARFSANASKASQASSRQKQLEKIKEDMVELRPSSRVAPRPVLKIEKPCGRQVVGIKDLKMGFEADKPLYSNLNIDIVNGEKVAIIGVNGVGKTTLLKLLMEQLQPVSGSIAWGQSAVKSYFPQDPFELLDPEMTAFDWLYQFRPSWSQQEIRALLGRMLFSGDAQMKYTKVLSGGEKARLLFAMLMAQQPNTIILDEPTNHLDLEAIAALNEELQEYEGSLIFVSHDRTFVSSLATRVIEIIDGQVIDFRGPYEDYVGGARDEMIARLKNRKK
ncbi:MAG TPA: ATP-binding cassette domain-containing protein [Fibrobacteria bacterium]|nr:ATP-binding cassette domain-containing protein [Fibrobacteria bacterium]HOX52851.1 ATP-binding cassette domain-containing protein [Fibrobacteria bacterium]